MDRYPEHEKLKALDGENQKIGNFIEWLNEQGYSICEWKEGRGYNGGEYHPARSNTSDMLAQYFEIDVKRLEDEKQAMLAELRIIREGKHGN